MIFKLAISVLNSACTQFVIYSNTALLWHNTGLRSVKKGFSKPRWKWQFIYETLNMHVYRYILNITQNSPSYCNRKS